MDRGEYLKNIYEEELKIAIKKEDPIEEAYRRGYHHGFICGRKILRFLQDITWKTRAGLISISLL